MIRPLSEVLAPSPAEGVARAQSDLRLGLPVVLRHEGAVALALAVETLTEDRLDALTEEFGAPELVLTANRASAVLPATLRAPSMGDVVRIQPPAVATTAWYKRLADTAFDNSGPLGPVHLIRDEVTALQSFALTLTKLAALLPAAVVFAVSDDVMGAAGLNTPPLSVEASLAHIEATPRFAPIAASHLPIEAYETGKLHVFRDPSGHAEHYAMEVGTPDPNKPVLCRLHSACFTGDVLGSLKCDCGPQLRAALARMGEEGSGVLLYLNQEGRGIGLANKMRVYDLQTQGLDTVEANHQLGFEDDERDFRVAAEMLHTLGFSSIRLLTNNPAKVSTLRGQGLNVVERMPLKVGRTAHNQHYLSVKALKSGHAL